MGQRTKTKSEARSSMTSMLLENIKNGLRVYSVTHPRIDKVQHTRVTNSSKRRKKKGNISWAHIKRTYISQSNNTINRRMEIQYFYISRRHKIYIQKINKKKN